MKLKPLVAAVAATIVSCSLAVGAHAQKAEKPKQQPNERAESACAAIGDGAKMTMAIRQFGMTLPEVRQKLLASVPEEGWQTVEEILQDAWAKPRYATTAEQQRAISDFAEKWKQKCHTDRIYDR